MPYLSPYIALYQRFIPINLFLSEPNNQEIKQTEFDHAGTSIININFTKKLVEKLMERIIFFLASLEQP